MEHPRAVIACRDLFSYSRLQLAVRAAGHEPVQADGTAAVLRALENARSLIVDLQDPGGGIEVIQAARRAREDLCIIAIGPHVDAPLLSAARGAGAVHVLTHGVASERIPRILIDIEPQLPPPGPGEGPPVPERPAREPPGGPTGRHA